MLPELSEVSVAGLHGNSNKEAEVYLICSLRKEALIFQPNHVLIESQITLPLFLDNIIIQQVILLAAAKIFQYLSDAPKTQLQQKVRIIYISICLNQKISLKQQTEHNMTDDHFEKANNLDGGENGLASMSTMSRKSLMSRSTISKKKADPYDLDFTQLRKDYVDSSSVKIPFVKSSFTHYSKCPRNMTINGKEYKDLIITMEVVQAPEALNYTQLEDPVQARLKAKIAKKKAEADAKRVAAFAEKLAAKTQRMVEKAARKAIRDEKKLQREQDRNNGIQGNSDEEEDESETEDEEDSQDEEDEEHSHEHEEGEEHSHDDESEEDYDVEDDDDEEDDDDDDYDNESGNDDEEDRLYAGDMFKGKSIKFTASPFDKLGQHNEKLGTNDYCCISLWSSGGKQQRYTRLKDTTLRVPPTGNNRKFRVGHDAKRLYYLGEMDGVKKLVLIYLKDLTHEFLDLGTDAAKIVSLEGSSLFKDYICYAIKEKQEDVKNIGKKMWRYTKNFTVFNFRSQEQVWHLPDCENVLFQGKDASEQGILEFEKIQKKLLDEAPDGTESDDQWEIDTADYKLTCENEDSDGEASDDEAHTERIERLHKGIVVIQSSYQERKSDDKKENEEKEGDEDKKETDAEAPATDAPATDAPVADAEEEKPKTKIAYFRVIKSYLPQWGKKINEKRLAFETEKEVKITAVPVQKVFQALGQEEDAKTTRKNRSLQLQENPLLVVSDNLCSIVSLIFQGIHGEQHIVNTFKADQKLPFVISSKASNLELEYNMNSHIRNADQIFLCETAPNDDCHARQLQMTVIPEFKIPIVIFTKAQRGFSKDCWAVQDDENAEDDAIVMTLCKSSTDEYINADCLRAKLVVSEEGAYDWSAKYTSSKMKAQEIDLNYPCLVSNVGLSRLMIQSLTCPDNVSTFDLDHLKMDFICFADYVRLEDIGFKDTRDPAQAEIVPFSETGDKIAFVTRKYDVCEADDECLEGDMLLNVLSIDSYSTPMRFELFTTTYEACMREGMADDAIQRCVAMQVTSARGLDVAFVAQYNDRIIYDCVTSTQELPLRFPLPADAKEAKLWTATDSDYKKGSIEFAPVDVFKSADMIRQPMIMDDKGAIYFMIKTHQGTVKVLRTDPLIEMGGAGFIKSVFTLRTSHVYFLLFREGMFYLMDDKKKVRVLKPNEDNHMWTQDNTFELPAADAKQIIYSDFDEYCISDGVLHYNDRMFYLLDSRAKDNDTWASANIMLENHLHVSGPRYAKETGAIWYIEQFAANISEVPMEDEEGADGKIDTHSHCHFKGFSVVMQPLGDLSYIDLLPQRGENHNNFVSFVTDETVLVNYSGRYLMFDLKGAFLGPIKFTGMGEGFRGESIKLVNVSDSGKFFVFKGPRFMSKEARQAMKAKRIAKKEAKKAAKKAAKEAKNPLANAIGNIGDKIEKIIDKTQKDKFKKFASGGKRAPIFYVFKLHMETRFDGSLDWTFKSYTTTLFPWIEPAVRSTMTQRIDYSGCLSQCLIKGSHAHGDETRKMEIIVKNYLSQDPNKVVVQEERGLFSFGELLDESPDSEERYRMSFSEQSIAEKMHVLERKIGTETRSIELGSGSQDALDRLQRRGQQMERAWVFDNFIVAKSGGEIKYIAREKSILGMYATSTINFAVEPGTEVWLENVFSTGIEDLIQLFLIDDFNKRLYIITWNLQFNREHSIFQTTYAPDIFPENLIMQGKATHKQQDFNYFMDSYAIVNLETNLPIQFFDTENESDVLPKGPLHAQVDGMKRISGDWSRYLDMTKPGRVHHFISLVDLMYWERFQVNKDKHEISKGVMTTFSPIARFPNGISVFHYFATNTTVLNTVEDSMTMAKQNRTDDVRVNMLPLAFLHSNPRLNEPGKKTTPIHIALDKQSPLAFELMFQMLVHQQKVCVTAQLLDVLDTIISVESQAVLDFFNNGFLITDQFAGLRALEWEAEGEELMCATPSAFLTDEYLQSLVKTSAATEDETDQAASENLVTQQACQLAGFNDDDAPCKYSVAVEPTTHEASDSNIKQVEAKLLDFNWVFIGDNSARLLKSLAETENDEIFAQKQISVFIDFLWQGYYKTIFNQLFMPFMVYFVSFVLYSGYFAKNESDELSIWFVAEIVCIVLFGKTFFTFLILEMIQLKGNGLSYFLDLWNIIDLTSLLLNALYVYGEVTNGIGFDALQVIGSIAVLLMWIKLFYWLRLFKPFSAFIRMITQIVMDIKVFMVMLLISLAAFANIVFVLNANRIHDGQAPIFSDVVGIPPIDALIHAYLTGLGDFNKDDYSEENSRVVWIMFILATVIVQLIFLNLLIAIMGDTFGRITAIMEQSTLKEMCGIMVDHVWLQKIDEIFENQRYILWLTPDTTTSGGTVVERQLNQLQELVKNNSEQQEARIIRAIGAVQEDVATLYVNVEESKKQLAKLVHDAKPEGEDGDDSEDSY